MEVADKESVATAAGKGRMASGMGDSSRARASCESSTCSKVWGAGGDCNGTMDSGKMAAGTGNEENDSVGA